MNPEISDADREALTRRPSGRPVMYQRWRRLLFLHWEVPADSIRRLLPDGLEVDLFEGRAFVGLVPFTMQGVRPARLPAVRGLSDFHETNVRTYVHHRGHQPGVWFFSLDAANAVGVALGRRWFGLPYFLARMSLEAEEADGALRLSYASDRNLSRPEAGDDAGRGHGPLAGRAGRGRHARILPGRAVLALFGVETRNPRHRPGPSRALSAPDGRRLPPRGVGRPRRRDRPPERPAPGALRRGGGRRGLPPRAARDRLSTPDDRPPSFESSDGRNPTRRASARDRDRVFREKAC